MWEMDWGCVKLMKKAIKFSKKANYELRKTCWEGEFETDASICEQVTLNASNFILCLASVRALPWTIFWSLVDLFQWSDILLATTEGFVVIPPKFNTNSEDLANSAFLQHDIVICYLSAWFFHLWQVGLFHVSRPFFEDLAFLALVGPALEPEKWVNDSILHHF